MKIKRRVFSKEFKLRVVREVQSGKPAGSGQALGAAQCSALNFGRR